MKDRNRKTKSEKGFTDIGKEFAEAGKDLGSFVKKGVGQALEDTKETLHDAFEATKPVVAEKIEKGKQAIVDTGFKGAKKLSSLARSAERYFRKKGPKTVSPKKGKTFQRKGR